MKCFSWFQSLGENSATSRWRRSQWRYYCDPDYHAYFFAGFGCWKQRITSAEVTFIYLTKYNSNKNNFSLFNKLLIVFFFFCRNWKNCMPVWIFFGMVSDFLHDIFFITLMIILIDYLLTRAGIMGSHFFQNKFDCKLLLSKVVLQVQ